MSERFALIKCYHDGRSPVLVGRNLSTKKIEEITIPSSAFHPYFYIPAETSDEDGPIAIDGTKVKEVVCERPSDVPGERSKYLKTFEADILYSRRYLIDKGLRSGFEVDGAEIKPLEVDYTPRTLYLDIESYPYGDRPDTQKDYITAVSLADNDRTVIASIVSGIEAEDERELLIKLAYILENADCDVISSYSDYDYEMLKARFELHNIDHYFFNSKNYFDILSGYRNTTNKISYKLRDVVLEEGITTEKQPQLDYRALFDKDKDELRRINVNHTSWLRKLDNKHKIVEYHWQLKSFCGLESLENVIHSSTLIDTLLLREYKGRYILPTRERHERVSYEGAIVFEPKKGVFTDVAVYDMKAYYPNCLISENLSPDVLSGVNKGVGVVPELMGKMLKMRYELQDTHPAKKAAIKGIINSVYGVFAYPNFRLYMPKIAERITEVAREGLTFLKGKCEGAGYTVIIGDTDSCFVQIPPGEAKGLEELLNVSLRDKFGERYEIQLEKQFSKLCCLGSKKKYFGYHNNELQIKGFQNVRTDSAKVTKEVQQKVMELVLDDDKEGIVTYLKDIVGKFSSYSYSDIAIPKGLSRSTKDYKIAVDYIRGAEWVKKKYKVSIEAGDRVYYIYAKKPYDTITVPDIEMFNRIGGLKVDKDKMIERCITKPVEDLIGILNIDWSEIEGQKRLL